MAAGGLAAIDRLQTFAASVILHTMSDGRLRMPMIFVERVFESASGEVLARFEAPYRAEGGEYRCRWHLVWEGGQRSTEIAGLDGVQALMLAMRNLHAVLTDSDEYREGSLTYIGQRDLDLPPAWGCGPLYNPDPPPD